MAKFEVGDIVKVIDPHLESMEKSSDDILWVDSMRSRINHLFKVTIVTPDGGYYIDDNSGFMWSGEWLEKFGKEKEERKDKMKFKVGDRVVGNWKANRYGITVRGWRGEVVRVNPFNGTCDILVTPIGPEKGFHKYWVESECFDLDKSGYHPDDRAKTTEKIPYKRRVIIEITDDGATAEYIVGKEHEKGVSVTRHKKDKPNDKFAALYAVSKLFGLGGTVEQFVRKDDLSDLNASIANARGYLEDAEAVMKHIMAAGK